MVSANARYFANMIDLFGLVGSNAMARLYRSLAR
jgi:hypothetical protein